MAEEEDAAHTRTRTRATARTHAHITYNHAANTATAAAHARMHARTRGGVARVAEHGDTPALHGRPKHLLRAEHAVHQL